MAMEIMMMRNVKLQPAVLHDGLSTCANQHMMPKVWSTGWNEIAESQSRGLHHCRCVSGAGGRGMCVFLKAHSKNLPSSAKQAQKDENGFSLAHLLSAGFLSLAVKSQLTYGEPVAFSKQEALAHSRQLFNLWM